MKITTEKGLIALLNLLGRNTGLSEVSDPAIEKFKKNIKNEKLLQEEESEEEPEEESAKEDTPEEAGSKKSPNPAADKAMSMGSYTDDFKGSFESIEDAINLIRAGRSLKDKSINTELQDYYDRLDENERAVLLIFLKELSKILTGAVEGDEAQDPSDPKTYFDITKRSKEDSNNQPAPEKEAESEVQSKPSGDTQGEEDTSPPIKVNESQDISKLRKIL